jgi:DNA-binding XRE family transcriptional regulator
MGHVQIVKTPSGDEMVVIPKAEYDALLRLATEAAEEAAEDAADVAAYDAAMAEIAADPDSRLPVEISGFMLKGDRLLAAIRKWRGLTQVEVSAAAGIAQGYLSDLEAGRRHGSVETLRSLAKAMNVPESWLV